MSEIKGTTAEGPLPEQEKLLPDADSEEPGKPRKTSAVKIILLCAAGLILLVFAFLSLNQLFGINDDLPMWDELYHAAGLRSQVYDGSREGAVSVHFIDVGQGDCALIQTGSRNILIDCGEAEEYANVAGYLKSAGVTRLDSVIMSHPHSDHMGCMYRLVHRYNASEVLMPDVPEYMLPVTGSFTKLEEAVKEMKIPLTRVKEGAFADTGGSGELKVLSPIKPYDDLNNSSLVLKYTFGEVSFLFCGDIAEEAESDLVYIGSDLSADVIKVPHHGSETSSTRPFVNAVSPVYAVFSVGEENDYGHPHDRTLKLYRNLGAEIYRTDTNGDIVFVTDGKTIDVYTEKETSADAA